MGEGLTVRAVIVAYALLAGGGVLAGRAGYMHAKAELASILIEDAWRKTVATHRTVPPWSWADTHPVARLSIPSIAYDEVVLEGASPRTMAFGPTRMMSGTAPGEPGNLVLAGHRTSWFKPLEHVKVGDIVVVRWPGRQRGRVNERTWRVTELRVIDPEDTSWIAPTFEDRLTLVTCHPFGPSPTSPHRYVVRAVPVEA